MHADAYPPPSPSPLARFGRSKVFLPVVHVTSLRGAVANARIARDAGADGVFLIDHAQSWASLLLSLEGSGTLCQSCGSESTAWTWMRPAR